MLTVVMGLRLLELAAEAVPDAIGVDRDVEFDVIELDWFWNLKAEESEISEYCEYWLDGSWEYWVSCARNISRLWLVLRLSSLMIYFMTTITQVINQIIKHCVSFFYYI